MTNFNQKEAIENPLDKEKNLLSTNSEEVLNLVVEKKDGQYTEKAKLLMTRIGRIAAIGVGLAGGVGAIAIGGSALYEHFTGMSNEINEITGELRNIPFKDAKEMVFAMDFSLFIGALGALGAEKLKDMIEKIKSKIEQIKTS